MIMGADSAKRGPLANQKFPFKHSDAENSRNSGDLSGQAVESSDNAVDFHEGTLMSRFRGQGNAAAMRVWGKSKEFLEVYSGVKSPLSALRATFPR
jgi:hypothetical protein